MRFPRRSRVSKTPDPLDGYDDDDTLGFAEMAALGINPRRAVQYGAEGLLDVRDGRATARSIREHLVDLRAEERIVKRVERRG